MDPHFRLDGRVALITGAASGIGEATARVFASAGAKVLIADLHRERAEKLARELPSAEPLVCDITDEQAVKRMFEAIEKLDVLVNNAGIGLVGGVEETSLEDFQRLFQVN